MTQSVILNTSDRRRFSLPPTFSPQERSVYFNIPRNLRSSVTRIKNPTNRAGYLLQLGYFRAAGKFFSAKDFRPRDIRYVCSQLGIRSVDVSEYVDSVPRRHRARIMATLNWTHMDSSGYEVLVETARRHARDQEYPKAVLAAMLDVCWKQRLVIPEYSVFANIIAGSFNELDSTHIAVLRNTLTDEQRHELDGLIDSSKTDEGDGFTASITDLKRINQSMRPQKIKQSIGYLQLFRDHFRRQTLPILGIDLTDKATRYYATWVDKADRQQLRQFPDRHKAYLHVLAFIKHQYYARQDAAVDVFLKAVAHSRNAATAQIRKNEQAMKRERDLAIRALRSAHLTATELTAGIIAVRQSDGATPSEKYYKIESLIDDYLSVGDSVETERIDNLDRELARERRNVPYFEVLENLSLRLQRRVNAIVCAVDFDECTVDPALHRAITYFQLTQSKVRQAAPKEFLSQEECDNIFDGDGFKASVYKMLLFFAMAKAIKAGHLNVSHSYRHRSLHDYLIPRPEWSVRKSTLLAQTGLEAFADGKQTLRHLRDSLDDRYWSINQRYKDGLNSSIHQKNTGGWYAHTPKTDFDTDSMISETLSQSGVVPILGVLRSIDDACHFTTAFRHHSNKHNKMAPAAETLMAGIMARGCNIGVNRLAKISLGIKPHTLRNTVNWFFSLENLRKANQSIVDMIGKLSLAEHYRQGASDIHSSSDGRKLSVAVSSLHANYSFKYFGKDKGVTDYTFIDDRNALFHSQVFSASDREAAYVIDGLLGNYVRDHQIHSTDTHGFTEIIFGVCYLLGIKFAPRLANLPTHRIYGFSAPSTYRNRGYEIIPSRPINRKLILENWDDILRFMATLMTGRTTASQLFKRLSSYAIDHPLYRALKEFGRIAKSDFILDYLDSSPLRQRIQKQLNRVELANKFSAAVFFDNNQSFQSGSLEEQKIASACKLIIQNSIVLWNYLYLSERVIETKKGSERQKFVELIRRGSLLSWQHVNLRGEYDFTKHASPSTPFDLPKIRRLVIH